MPKLILTFIYHLVACELRLQSCLLMSQLILSYWVLMVSAPPRLQHIAIMDQAGSGKTLAYLLPMLQLLRQEEKKTAAAAAVEDSSDETGKPQFLAQPGAPRLIVAAPTIGQ